MVLFGNVVLLFRILWGCIFLRSYGVLWALGLFGSFPGRVQVPFASDVNTFGAERFWCFCRSLPGLMLCVWANRQEPPTLNKLVPLV